MVKSGATLKLIGEYTNKLISGHRIVLPASLRKQLGKNVVITKGYEGCLLVVPLNAWENLIAPMQSRSFLDRNVRDSLRFLVGSAFEVSCDAQGRVVVPESLRKYANTEFTEKIEKEVVFVGLLHWVEIWDKQRWVERSSFVEANADTIANELIASEEGR